MNLKQRIIDDDYTKAVLFDNTHDLDGDGTKDTILFVDNNGQKQALAILFDYETDLATGDFDGVGAAFSITAGTFEIV